MSRPVTIVITDPALAASIQAAEGQIIFQTADGTPLRTVETVTFGKPPPGVVVPFSDEEMAELRTQRTGRPLADILKDLRAKYGE